jgi:hypothetical protein
MAMLSRDLIGGLYGNTISVESNEDMKRCAEG